LLFNFHTVIVPEAMAAFQRHDASVMGMLADLYNLLTTFDAESLLLLLVEVDPVKLEENRSLLTTVGKLRVRYLRYFLPSISD